ncbi:MAG TPA: MBL fold metallo-hydrolase, partial [Clostridia bacterium]|nr:MBL fold metallo-hydrolase [Clostridia bacterium]
MKLKFCGAAQCVTGSCHMMQFAGKQILVDCGMRQGADAKTEFGEGEFPFSPAEIDAVLLTHAHIDHSGLIPLLVKRGFAGKIIATRATAELAGIMLPDSGHIQEQEAEYQNRKNLRAGKPQVQPLYTAEDAVDCLKAFRSVTYNDIVEIVPGMRARFVDAGHLLGSAAIEVWANEAGKTLKIVFSGDVGRDNRPILQDPQPIDGADYLLMEGTYGDRDHEVREAEDKEEELANLLREGMTRGGNIVIPSFAIG